MVAEALTIRFLIQQQIFHEKISAVLKRMYKRYLETVTVLREERYNWVFTEDDVEELRIENAPSHFTLPTVDLKGYLPIASNNDIPELLGKHNVKVIHKTQDGLWCPLFPTREDAIAAIRVINVLIDDTVLHPEKKDD